MKVIALMVETRLTRQIDVRRAIYVIVSMFVCVDSDSEESSRWGIHEYLDCNGKEGQG